MPTARIRKSGNSTVLVIPPEVIKEKQLKVGQEVGFEIYKEVNLRQLFGKSKKFKMSTQKIKDILRKEW